MTFDKTWDDFLEYIVTDMEGQRKPFQVEDVVSKLLTEEGDNKPEVLRMSAIKCGRVGHISCSECYNRFRCINCMTSFSQVADVIYHVHKYRNHSVDGPVERFVRGGRVRVTYDNKKVGGV